MRIPHLLFYTLTTLMASCAFQTKEQKSENIDSPFSIQKRTQALDQTVTPEEAKKLIDSMVKHGEPSTTEELKTIEHTIISVTDKRFDSEEAETALDILAAALKRNNLLQDGHYFITESYDATGKYYVLRQGINDTTVVSDLVAWWHVYPGSKKIVNATTEEELH